MGQAEALGRQCVGQLQKENARLGEMLKGLSDDMLELREKLHEEKESNKKKDNKIRSL